MTADLLPEHWGAWYGPCPRCGTSHDGADPTTLGGHTRCITAQAHRLAHIAPHLVAMTDQLDAHIGRRRDEALTRAWNLTHPDQETR